MKKWSTLLAVATLTLGLAACNETAAPANEKDVTEKSELTLQEVYDKSMAASEELKSVKAKIDMKQTMQLPGQDVNLDINSLMDMDYIIDPLQIHQTGTTSMKSTDENMGNQEMKMESYITKDAFYTYEGESGQWMKFPQEMMNQLMSTTDQSNPSNQLKQIEGYLEDFTFEQDNDNYILTLEASGEKFTELVKEQVDEALQNMVGVEEIEMDMIINSVNYLIHIDKETFQTNKVDMVLDMDMTIDGETMNMKQDMKSDFSNFNQVEEIVIPQEVIDNAVEI
ncbi:MULTISPECIES: DUF6612 family protein [Bacillaceae]|uniref:DUF6612 family protein n=1 Tax=Bacillaceae TaxID=186817 RepID=UPI0006BD4D1F|nr:MULTISPECIES: DUF6612 family protein [Bacillaceae]ALC88315.1 hypothetical protein AM499_18640 [Bacillus sp. FJAT-22090]KQL35134.1 hypothetical protein AN959_11765 [Psychrobacillus sp. FJAT-21963]MDF2065355.1 hypothetical protein [Bacillus sp. Cr_A10]